MTTITNEAELWEDFDIALKSMNKLKIKEIKENQCICPPGKQELFEDTSQGCVVCINCGVVTEPSIIDQGSEWREFTSEDGGKGESKSRCGLPANPLFPKSNLGTRIGPGGGAWGARLSKISNWNSMPYEERVIWEVLSDFKNKAGPRQLPSMVIDEAINLFKKLNGNKLDGKKEIHRGKVRDGLIANCLYHACKIHKIERSLLEIGDIMEVNISDMTRGRKLYTEMTGNLDDDLNNVTSGKDFVIRFCSKLNLPWKVSKLCNDIIFECEKTNFLSSSTPQSLSSGVIYFVSNELVLNISKKDVAVACGVSEITISKLTKKLIENKETIFSEISKTRKSR